MRYLFWLAFCAFFTSLIPACADSHLGELPRAGAPRPLRLVAPDGAPLKGVPGDVAWERRGDGVFFTLERDGTRNIWRAFPDPQDPSRFPAWRALPVTDLRAPRYAAQPCPLPNDRALVCVSNVLASAATSARAAQIVRFDLADTRWTALSDGARFYESPHVSPDGKRVAFAGEQDAQMRVFTALTDNPRNRVLPEVAPIIGKARHPVWLDNNILLIESLAPQARGLYSLALGQSSPRMVIGGGGEANIVGTNGIVFSAKTARDAAPGLYLVARDGSGLRALSETTGARRPATSPDANTLAFDAPHNGTRALYLLPLLRAQNSEVAENKSNVRLIADENSDARYEEPAAQLTAARTASAGIAIIGNLRGAPNSVATLEVGEGEKPRQWKKLEIKFPPTSPILDAQNNRVLTFWNPPRARGLWTFRLSLSGLGGGAQSLLRVRLPLPVDALPPIPTPVKNQNLPTDNAATSFLPRATPLPIPPIPAPLPILPTPVNGDNDDDLPVFPAIQSPDMPAIPAPVPPIVPPLVQPVGAVAPLPIPPVVVPAKTPPTAQIPVEPADVAATNETPDIVRVDGDNNDSDDGNYGDAPAATGEPFSAQFDVAGTPARMEPHQKVKVTFRAINRGTSTWETGSNGENRVRLVARWVDFSTGARRQWNFFWLRDAVAASERTAWEFDLTAPARPGKYKLIYGLVRLPASGEFKAPAYSASQQNWDGEFGAIAFAVEVAPKSR